MAAQQVSFRLGGLHARYADSLTGDAAFVGARLAWSGASASAVLDAGYSQFASGGGAIQAWTNAQSWRAIGPAFLGIRGNGVANGTTNGLWTGWASVGAFAMLVRGAWSASLDLGGGGVRTVDSSALATGAAAVRARRTLGPFALSATVIGNVSTGPRWVDGSLGAEWRSGSVSVGVQASARTGDLANAPWAQAWGEARLSRTITFEAGVGSYPQDLTGFARGFYLNAGVRVALSGPGHRAIPEPDVMVRPFGSDSASVSFAVPGSDSVAIVGSWNDWVASPLTRDARGRWTAVLPIGPGTWRFALVVGERWIVPAGVTSLPDDFGGQVGILVRQ
jgi:hypothetical protein